MAIELRSGPRCSYKYFATWMWKKFPVVRERNGRPGGQRLPVRSETACQVLGVRVAQPGTCVISIMGDGTFNYDAALPAFGYCEDISVYHNHHSNAVFHNTGGTHQRV